MSQTHNTVVDYDALSELAMLTMDYYSKAVLAERGRSAAMHVRKFMWWYPQKNNSNLIHAMDRVLTAFKAREVFAGYSDDIEGPAVELEGSLWERLRELDAYCEKAEEEERQANIEREAERERARSEKAARKQAEAQSRRNAKK